MAEAESEFRGYTGDCVWAAVHMGAHHLAPNAWPLDAATLNRLTSEAIAAGIGVGARGEATPGQLQHMLAQWGMRYSVGYNYNGVSIPAGQLQSILDGALARGKPILLGFTNGQALTGDEVGLHGHEIVVLHPGYACGDGDNPICATGQTVTYSLATLEAAQPDSAYVLEEVPGMSGVPAGWTDDHNGDATVDGTLTAPNGVHVVLGFRKKVLEGWDPQNYPLGPQYHKTAAEGGIEPGNTGIGEGDRIDFRMSSLGYTVSRGVYAIWTGQDLQALQSQLQAARAQIAQLVGNAAQQAAVAAIQALAAALAAGKAG